MPHPAQLFLALAVLLPPVSARSGLEYEDDVALMNVVHRNLDLHHQSKVTLEDNADPPSQADHHRRPELYEEDVALVKRGLHRERAAATENLSDPVLLQLKDHTDAQSEADHHRHPAQAPEAAYSATRSDHKDQFGQWHAHAQEAPYSATHSNPEDQFRAYDVSISCMLLGIVIFVMLLLYLVNWNDQDIRRYAWGTISVTLSIFTSLLMFSGINECLLDLVHAWTRDEYMLVVFQYSHFLFWVIVLQFVLAFCSGGFFEGDEPPKSLFMSTWVINDAMRYDYEAPVCDTTVRTTRKGVTRSVAIVKGLEVPVVRRRMELQARKTNLKCSGMILGHMAAFADIRAGHQLQDLAIFKASPWLSLLPILLNFVFVWMLYMFVDQIREAEKARRFQLGKESKNSRIDMFDNAAEETENEVLSLSSSYLIYNTTVFFITGALPSSDPKLRAEALKKEEVDFHRICYLVSAGLFAALLTGALHWAGNHEEALDDDDEAQEDTPAQEDSVGFQGSGEGQWLSSKRVVTGRRQSSTGRRRSSLKLLRQSLTIAEIMEHQEEPFLKRYLEVLTVTSAITFAWCVREALIWRLRMSATLQGTPLGITAMGGKVLLSFFVSMGAFVVIFLLDKIDDACREEEGCDESSKLIVAIINSIAILVGLSWEESFDSGVEELSTILPHAHAWQLAAAAAVAVLIVPAWALYILKKAMLLEEYYKKQLLASVSQSCGEGSTIASPSPVKSTVSEGHSDSS